MASNQPTFTGFEPEIQDITRQREMAKLLLQQGLQNNMQGQMVSGRYVGAHPIQGIANMYSAYKGRQLAEEADRKQADLAEKLRTLQSTEAADILSALKGTTGTPDVVPQGQTLRDDQGQLTYGAQAGTPAVAGSRSAALAKALAGRSGFSQTMAAKLMEQEFKEPKWEKVERLNARGDTVTGMIDVNSPQPELTFREIGVSKPSISVADAARLRDEGINIGGGYSPTPPVGQPSFQSGGQSTSAPSGVSASPVSYTAPAPVASGNAGYVYNPSLSPKQNRELQSKFTEEQQTKVRNAGDSLSVIKDAVNILNSNAPSSGGAENIVTGVREFFGGGGKASEADAQLAILSEKLTAQVPRFSGATSDKDLDSYRRAAGDLGNANKPISTRLAAAKTLIDLNKKYFPSPEWDKIDLGGPVVIKNPLGGTRGLGAKTITPDEFMQGLNDADKEAFKWLRKHPNHPKANAIRDSLGIQ